MIPFKQFTFLTEALSDRHKNMIDDWGVGDHSFSDHVFGGPQETHHTIQIPLAKPIPPNKEIKDHLESHGYSMEGYANGTVKDKHGRDVKVGRALSKTKAPHLIPTFQQDPGRAVVHITRHPHGVGGMSTGKNWTSCMTIEGNHDYWRKHLPADLEHGTHVAYLGFPEDTNFDRPLARIALKPFENEDYDHKILRPEQARRDYGIHNSNFANTVRGWAEKHFPTRDDVYHKSHDLYDDDGNTTVYNTTNPELIHHDDPEVRSAVIQHAKLEDHHVDHLIEDDEHVDDLAHNDHLTSGQIHKVISSEYFSPWSIKNLSQRPNFNSSHIDALLNRRKNYAYSGSYAGHAAALEQATPEQRKRFIYSENTESNDHETFLDRVDRKALDKDDISHYVNAPNLGPITGANALYHHNSDRSHIQAYMKRWKDHGTYSGYDSIKSLLNLHPEKFDKKTLTSVMDMYHHDYDQHHILALGHHEADGTHVTQALNPRNSAALIDTALESKHAKQEHFDMVLNNHGDYREQNIAKALSKTTDVTHLDRFSHVMDYDIQKAITSNPLARHYHFQRNLNHTAEATDSTGVHSFKELGVRNNPHLDKHQLIHHLEDSKHHFGDGKRASAMNYHDTIINHPNADGDVWSHALRSPSINKVVTAGLFQGQNVTRIEPRHIDDIISAGHGSAVQNAMKHVSLRDMFTHNHLTQILDNPEMGPHHVLASSLHAFQPGVHMDRIVDRAVESKNFHNVQFVKHLTPEHIDRIVKAGGYDAVRNHKWGAQNIHDFLHDDTVGSPQKEHILKNNAGVNPDHLHAAIKLADQTSDSRLGAIALQHHKSDASHLEAGMKSKNFHTQAALAGHKDFNSSHVDHMVNNFPEYHRQALANALDHPTAANEGHIDKAFSHSHLDALNGDSDHDPDEVGNLHSAAISSRHATEKHVEDVLVNTDNHHPDTISNAIHNEKAMREDLEILAHNDTIHTYHDHAQEAHDELVRRGHRHEDY